MKLEFTYQFPHTNWSIFHVFDKFYKNCETKLKKHKITRVNSSNHYIGNPGAMFSPHIMTIRNIKNNKYIIISYWDHPQEFDMEHHGWDVSKRVGLYTSSGIKGDESFIPFSYLPYTTLYDELSKNALSVVDKKNNELIFRGFLHGQRHSLAHTNKIKIIDEKIMPENLYFDDLTNNKVCLSLNGAAEICNRDIEILSAKSVLLRPILKQKFHNDLIPDFHYVGFEQNDDPNIQADIILEKYNEIKNNDEYLTFISENGYKWFLENGTIDANVNILEKIIDFKILR
jgi:disulfide oxidoreductase YuzD